MPAQVRWIGHAGFARDRPGGTPTRQTLAVADRLHVDWIEIDVCRSSDGSLLLRHDLMLPSGRRVRSTSADAVRAEDPDVLTIDEAAEVLSPGSAQILVDLKDAAAARAVAAWLATRADSDRWALCSDDLDALLTVRDGAPRIARWRGLPRVAPGRAEPLRRAAACAMRSRLPGQLARLAGEAGAAALTVDRWAITPRLCAEASALGLPVAAWTVNAAPVARRMAAAGVDRLTTDRVVEMRAAIGAQDGAATARCDG
jgi:glycerophosphoryl diester phosphodiesterase